MPSPCGIIFLPKAGGCKWLVTSSSSSPPLPQKDHNLSSNRKYRDCYIPAKFINPSSWILSHNCISSFALGLKSHPIGLPSDSVALISWISYILLYKDLNIQGGCKVQDVACALLINHCSKTSFSNRSIF